MKPLIKWIGGKRKFLTNHIFPETQKYKFNKYYEPFVGSGALFFKLNHNSSIINDLNKDLINFYEHVRDEPLKLREKIKELVVGNEDKESFIKIRKQYNDCKEMDIDKAAMFFYLNKRCFNGIYRVNSSGKYNVPFGKTNSGSIFIPSTIELEEASFLLKKTTIQSIEWYESIVGAKRGDLIYLDPPYYPDESSKFIGYTDPCFGKEEHKFLVETILKYSKKGVNILLSNSNSSEFHELIDKIIGSKIKWKKESINTKRSINPQVVDKTKFVEVLYVFEGKKITKEKK